jgi:hypothetical protein
MVIIHICERWGPKRHSKNDEAIASLPVRRISEQPVTCTDLQLISFRKSLFAGGKPRALRSSLVILDSASFSNSSAQNWTDSPSRTPVNEWRRLTLSRTLWWNNCKPFSIIMADISTRRICTCSLKPAMCTRFGGLLSRRTCLKQHASCLRHIFLCTSSHMRLSPHQVESVSESSLDISVCLFQQLMRPSSIPA